MPKCWSRVLSAGGDVGGGVLALVGRSIDGRR